MTTYRLERIFNPRSIAIVGGSPRPSSVGRKILANVRAAGFDGALYVVNPNHPTLDGIATTRSPSDLPPVDLMVVASPPPSVAETIAAAGARGCSAAVIITAGLGQGPGSFAAATEEAARAHSVRLIGPNCLGVQAPKAKLNASFAARMAAPGGLALISQSGAIVAALAEWAASRSLGFSGLVSLGNQIDVDFGDLLDYFSQDIPTNAIVLYIEQISNARKFMSAARAAARTKPVIVIKAGRHAQGARAARTHTGALAGSDAVYDAAFRRAGLVRVFDLDEMFDAAETLGRLRPFEGDRLAILTNGGGVGVLAVDRLIDLGGRLADLSEPVVAALDKVLPAIWSRANPLDIAGDAGPDRYTVALEALLDDRANDAVLVMNVPTALASAQEAATAVASAVRRRRVGGARTKPVFSVWLGASAEAGAELHAAGIPRYPSESDAVRGFMHLVRYRQAQNALMVTPPSLPADFVPDVAAARAIVEAALDEGRTWLDPVQVAGLLAAYGIPGAPVLFAADPPTAARVAEPLLASVPVAVKILSPDIPHKSDVGGVRLDLPNAAAVETAAAEILARARQLRPQARLTGVIVQPMVTRRRGRELIAGLTDDPTFGPVVVFGAGGTAVEVINDKALALAPLDLVLARDLIARTRVARLLAGYRDVPPADVAAIALTLVKLSQMAVDLPEVAEVDLNPLLADAQGVMAVDARVAIARAKADAPPTSRFAVRPYPTEWERSAQLRNGIECAIRPVRPQDEVLYPAFLDRVSPADRRLRFFAPIKEFPHGAIARFTQIDYARAMAFIAIDKGTGEMLGVSRLHRMTHSDVAEYAVLVRSDLKGQGLGWILMSLLIEYARREGITAIHGEVLKENTTMLQMCSELGFSIAPNASEPDICAVTLPVKALP